MATSFKPASLRGPVPERQRFPRRLTAASAAAFVLSAGLLSAGCSESDNSSVGGDTPQASTVPASAPSSSAPSSSTPSSLPQSPESTASEQTYADAWGPAAGSQIPMLAAADQTGQPQTLSSLSGGKGLLLVFSRSADW